MLRRSVSKSFSTPSFHCLLPMFSTGCLQIVRWIYMGLSSMLKIIKTSEGCLLCDSSPAGSADALEPFTASRAGLNQTTAESKRRPASRCVCFCEQHSCHSRCRVHRVCSKVQELPLQPQQQVSCFGALPTDYAARRSTAMLT